MEYESCECAPLELCSLDITSGRVNLDQGVSASLCFVIRLGVQYSTCHPLSLVLSHSSLNFSESHGIARSEFPLFPPRWIQMSVGCLSLCVSYSERHTFSARIVCNINVDKHGQKHSCKSCDILKESKCSPICTRRLVPRGFSVAQRQEASRWRAGLWARLSWMLISAPVFTIRNEFSWAVWGPTVLGAWDAQMKLCKVCSSGPKSQTARCSANGYYSDCNSNDISNSL